MHCVYSFDFGLRVYLPALQMIMENLLDGLVFE